MKKDSSGWRSNVYIRFSSIGIQMGVIIFIFTWLGIYLDEYLKMETPWMTVVFSLLGVIGSLVLIIREVLKLNQNDDSKSH
jgi:F0F1-type ATP synthase assembly protein I